MSLLYEIRKGLRDCDEQDADVSGKCRDRRCVQSSGDFRVPRVINEFQRKYTDTAAMIQTFVMFRTSDESLEGVLEDMSSYESRIMDS